MMNLRRHRRAAALGLLVGLCWPAMAAAQDNSTVGNPQLRDFQLRGERTTPPAQPQPTAPTPAPVTARPAPTTAAPGGTAAGSRPAAPAAGSTTSRPTTAPPRATAPAAPPTRAPARAARAAPERTPPATAPAPAPAATTPAPVLVPPPAAQAPAPAPQAAPPTAAPPPAQSEAPASPPFNLNWLWLLVPVLLGIGAFVLLRRRRREGEEADRGSLADALVLGEPERPQATPPPAEPAPAVPPPAEAPRPWLEIDIAPARASATQNEAILAYELIVTNVGNAPARNIRIDTRMFNAADEPAIAAFLGGPIHRHSGSPHVALPPGESLRLDAEIGMKAEEVQAIELQGRRIFVPSLAINVAYDWGESGEGRTSKSWLVGRETETPNARMGAFRLDLGPRIYRSVGRRDAKRVMV